MTNVPSVNQSQFSKEVIQSNLPVVVDFHATWCPPCRALAPIIDKLAEDFEGEVKFVKVDSDEEQELAAAFNVTALPTLIFLKNGQVTGQSRGLPQESELREKLTKWLEAPKVASN